MFTGAVLLSRRSHRVLSVRTGDEASGPQPRVWGAVQLYTRLQWPAAYGGDRPEPGHAPGPRGQLQVLPALPHARHRLPRGQDCVASAIQWGILVLDIHLYGLLFKSCCTY